jgi:hypothetical protein
VERYATDTLAELIAAKRDRLAALGELGRRQLAMIEEGDMDRLLDLLAVKQRCLNELQRIERALDPFRREDPERRVWRTPEARSRCAEQIDECRTMLAEIVSREKCSERALVERRDQAARQLEGAYRGIQARGAYAPTEPATSHQLDLLSGG